MAFDFLGTFNRSQFDRLTEFTRAQLQLVESRITHLVAEQTRVGALTMVIVNGVPSGYSADPSSYIGKLIAAYEVMGGDPFYDLQVRLSSDPVYLIKGDEATNPQVYSSGEVQGTAGLADGESAFLVSQMRGWTDETIIYRRELLERKIRRMMDYVDQLQQEIDRLTIITQSEDTANSLENLITQVNTLIDDTSYRAIQDDGGKDPFGTQTYAPFAGYEAGGSEREGSEGYGRAEGGYVVPGEIPPPPDEEETPTV